MRCFVRQSNLGCGIRSADSGFLTRARNELQNATEECRLFSGLVTSHKLTRYRNSNSKMINPFSFLKRERLTDISIVSIGQDSLCFQKSEEFYLRNSRRTIENFWFKRFRNEFETQWSQISWSQIKDSNFDFQKLKIPEGSIFSHFSKSQRGIRLIYTHIRRAWNSGSERHPWYSYLLTIIIDRALLSWQIFVQWLSNKPFRHRFSRHFQWSAQQTQSTLFTSKIQDLFRVKAKNRLLNSKNFNWKLYKTKGFLSSKKELTSLRGDDYRSPVTLEYSLWYFRCFTKIN